ncbi:hypothetical protein B0H12DRAFT_1073422 [Mycena haematopus]|nr:hypothetical protein B0H12DRAFT_1073422 [Mycena haematopus]
MPLPELVKPTNFLSLSRGNAPIKGKYVIDPRIKIPQPMLPPLAEDETETTRRNMFLHTSNGAIDADVFIIGDGDFKQKVNILVKSSNGAVVVKLHAPASARPPVKIKAQGTYGSVTLHVPRSFCGPVTISTRYGSIRFSDSLLADLTTFNEANKTRRCFIGDYSNWAEQSDGWIGDEIELETTYGSIKLQYDIESNVGSSKGKGKGLFAKLLRA